MRSKELWERPDVNEWHKQYLGDKEAAKKSAKQIPTSSFKRRGPETMGDKFGNLVKNFGRKLRGGKSSGFVPNFADLPDLDEIIEFLRGVNVDFKDERWGEALGVGGLSYPGQQRTEVVDSGAAEKQRIEKLIASDDTRAEEKAILEMWRPDLKGDAESLKTTRHEVTHQMWDEFFQEKVGNYMSSNQRSAAGHLRTIIDNTNLFKGEAKRGAYDMTLLEPLLDKIESGKALSPKEDITLDSLRGWRTEGRDPSWEVKGLPGMEDFGFPITGIDSANAGLLSEQDHRLMLSDQRAGTDTISEKQLFKILSELVVNESMAFGAMSPESEGFSLKGEALLRPDGGIEVEKVGKAEKAVAALVGEGDVEAGTKTLNELQQLNITRHLPIDADLKTKFEVRKAQLAKKNVKVAPEVKEAFETTKPHAMQPKKPEVAYPSLGRRITREDLGNLDYENNDYYLQPLPATKEAVSELQDEGLKPGIESGIRDLKKEKVDPDNLDSILRLMNPEEGYPDHYFPLSGQGFAQTPETYRAAALMRVPKNEEDKYGIFATDPDGGSSPRVRGDPWVASRFIEGIVLEESIPLGDEKGLLGLRLPTEVAQRPEGPKAQARDFQGGGGRQFPPAFQGPQVKTPHIPLTKLETLSAKDRQTKFDEEGRRLTPPVQRTKEAAWKRQESANQITTAIDNFRSSDDPIDKKAVKEYDRHVKSADKER